MNDAEILKLYYSRSENAIAETGKRYGAYCYTIAFNILGDAEDSEECVSDAYLRAWASIPPHRPEKLAAYLGKITRNLALDKIKHLTAEKRGNGRVPAALEELAECVPTTASAEEAAEERFLTEALNRFLASLPREARTIFLRRYWYLCSVREIAGEMRVSESKVKMSLLRSRGKLKEFLEKEGIAL